MPNRQLTERKNSSSSSLTAISAMTICAKFYDDYAKEMKKLSMQMALEH
jgi:hypothetical protein